MLLVCEVLMRSRLSVGIVFGLMLSLALIGASMFLAGDIRLFFNLPSFFITVGGTTGVMITAFPFSRLKTLGSVLKKAFVIEKFDLQKDIDVIVALDELGKRKGLLSLEGATELYEGNDFIKRGITLIMDGADEDKLRDSLESETYFMQQRHQKGVAMVEMIANTTPALGLLGTYIGLIPMLTSLDDPTKLGPLMAVELVTSFYGSFIANLIFSPIAKRLKLLNRDEVSRRDLMTEGLVGILMHKNPRIIREELNFFLASREVDTQKRRGSRFRSTDEERVA